jgi:hypothetical protein
VDLSFSRDRSALDQEECGLIVSNPPLVRGTEDVFGAGPVLPRPWPCSGRSCTFELIGHLDDASGVHHVVRRVENAPIFEPGASSGVASWLVGAAADNLARKLGDLFS